MQPKFYRPRDLVGTAKTRREGDKGLLGTSPAWLWRQVQARAFPQPIRLSRGVTGFAVDEVDSWIAARKGERA